MTITTEDTQLKNLYAVKADIKFVIYANNQRHAEALARELLTDRLTRYEGAGKIHKPYIIVNLVKALINEVRSATKEDFKKVSI